LDDRNDAERRLMRSSPAAVLGRRGEAPLALVRSDRPDAAMIDTAIIFALGFLAASLLILLAVPLVHRRAERLTTERIEESIPIDVAEMHAQKDQLRAEFALTTRRLEGRIEQLTEKLAGQLAEAGRKGATINRQRLELEAKVATIATLKDRSSLFDGDGADESAIEARWQQEFTQKLADKEATIAKLQAETDRRARTIDTQRIEIATLTIRINALMDRVTELAKTQSPVPDEPEQRHPILRLVR
jgi:hypothetical protein